MPPIVIYTDGGSRNNPGPAASGAVIKDGDKLLAEIKKFLGIQTNNWAEYEAVALALARAQELGFTGRHIELRMDSKLVAEQLMGNWRVKEPTLKPQWMKVRALMRLFPHVTCIHIRREFNKEADALVNAALDEAGY